MSSQASQPKRRGRKPKPFVCPWDNRTIDGLRRRPSDGRWEILATGQTFVEPDERRAVDRFRELTGQAETKGERSLKTYYKRVGIDWDAVAREIRTRPLWVAKKTGIEWIGWGAAELRPPEPLPTFDALEQTWRDHFGKSAEQKRKVLAAWRDFVATAKVAGLRDIETATVVAYRDAVYGRGTSGKSQQNLFTRIRRLLTVREVAGRRGAGNRALSERPRATDAERINRQPRPEACRARGLPGAAQRRDGRR